MQYDERRTRWYQSILLIQDSSGPLRARSHLLGTKLSGAHPLLNATYMLHKGLI